jgi:hypothetical protein
LAGIRTKSEVRLAAIREKWRLKRAELERLSILKRNRRNLLQLARKSEAAELAEAKAQAAREREDLNREQPCCSWQDFLRLEAEQGDEIALAVLRSRQSAVEPEAPPIAADRGKLAAAKADYAAQQVEILQNGDLTSKGKKNLLAFLRMENVIREEREAGAITRSVDKKGAVVFSFADGGKIRDCGGVVFFSADRERLALRYARQKWGPNCVLDKGRILFDRTRLEKERAISLPPQPVQEQSVER